MKLGITIFLIGISEAITYAGVGAHGGNVVLCESALPVTLDYYDAALPTVGGLPDLINLNGLTATRVVELIRSRFEGSPFQKIFDRIVVHFGPLSQWPVADLEDVDDGGEPYSLPKTCRRVTAAVRQGETIYIDLSVFSLLSEAQKGLLYLHEILYYISKQDTSSSVRRVLRTLLKRAPAVPEIAQAIQLIGPFYGYEMLIVGSTFRPVEDSQFLHTGFSIKGVDLIQKMIGVQASPNGVVAFKDFFDCRDQTLCSWGIYITQTGSTVTCQVEIFDERHIDVVCPVNGMNKLSRFNRTPQR